MDSIIRPSADIEEYINLQTFEDQNICGILTNEINGIILDGESKIWHGSPVWFINGNPLVGYCKLKNSVQLLFWSGQSFEEEGLKAVGKYKAAEVRYTEESQINIQDLHRWLNKSMNIQWDYKNIVKRKGVLERLK